MKVTHAILAGAVLLGCCLAAGAQTATNSITVDGKTYSNPKIQRIEGNEAVIFHSGGIARLSLDSLTDEQRSAFGAPTRAALAEQRRKEAAFAEEQKQRGLVRANGQWFSPDKLPTIESEHDDIQSVTWYDTKRDTRKEEYHTSYSVSLYVGKHDNGYVNFRFRTRYHDSRSEYHDTRWIFYESVHLLGDNGARLDVVTEHPQKKEDNDTYGLTEWADNNVEAKSVLLFRDAKRIQVMFKGKYSNTFDMTPEQLCAFQEMIALYSYLTKDQRTTP